MSEQVMYITTTSSLTIKLAGKRYTAVNGVLRDLPPSAVADLDRLLKDRSRADIISQVKKVDLEAAAKKAREHLAAQPQAAIRGVVTSGTQAAAVMRAAKKAQEETALTGVENPINTSAKPNQGAPLEVQTVDHQAPANKGALLGRMQKH